MVLESAGGGGTAEPMQMLSARMETVTRQAAQIQSSAKNFAAAAGKGFQIDPQAAATLINSCRHSITDLTDLQAHLYTVAQTPQLGQSPGAQVISPFTQSVATDTGGILPAIESLQQTLTDMIAAYKKASTNYEETEALVQRAIQAEHRKLA
jgi:hypothetical protein